MDRGTPNTTRQLLVNAASSTGRCNTIQGFDSAILPPEIHTFCCNVPKPNQGNVSGGLTLASHFNDCFQCQRGSSLVLRRPIESTAETGQVESPQKQMSGNATKQELKMGDR
jgi:hypothetical protein